MVVYVEKGPSQGFSNQRTGPSSTGECKRNWTLSRDSARKSSTNNSSLEPSTSGGDDSGLQPEIIKTKTKQNKNLNLISKTVPEIYPDNP